jgi:hypothetical protein
MLVLASNSRLESGSELPRRGGACHLGCVGDNGDVVLDDRSQQVSYLLHGPVVASLFVIGEELDDIYLIDAALSAWRNSWSLAMPLLMMWLQ